MWRVVLIIHLGISMISHGQNFPREFYLELANHNIVSFVHQKYDQYDQKQLVQQSGARLLFQAGLYDMYELKQILQQGTFLLCDNSFTQTELITLLEINADHVMVTCSGFTDYQIKQLLEKGAWLYIDNSLEEYTIRQLITSWSPQLIIDGKGFETYDITQFFQAGAKIIVGQEYEMYNLNNWVSTFGQNVIIDGKNLEDYELTNLLDLNARLLLDNFFEPWTINQLTKTKQANIRIICDGFDDLQLNEMADKGFEMIFSHGSRQFQLSTYLLPYAIAPVSGKVRTMYNDDAGIRLNQSNSHAELIEPLGSDLQRISVDTSLTRQYFSHTLLTGDFKGEDSLSYLFRTVTGKWYVTGMNDSKWRKLKSSDKHDFRGAMYFTGRFSGESEELLVYLPEEDVILAALIEEKSLSWIELCSTKGFGSLVNKLWFIDHFSSPFHEDLLFYSPEDQSWWLGERKEKELTWRLISNEKLNAQHVDDVYLTADLVGDERKEILFNSASNGYWIMGVFEDDYIKWSSIGETAGFGPLHEKLWFDGNYVGDDKQELLFYSPHDHHWWLAKFENGQLSWHFVSNSIGQGRMENKLLFLDKAPDGYDRIVTYTPETMVWNRATMDVAVLTWEQLNRPDDKWYKSPTLISVPENQSFMQPTLLNNKNDELLYFSFNEQDEVFITRKHIKKFPWKGRTSYLRINPRYN